MLSTQSRIEPKVTRVVRTTCLSPLNHCVSADRVARFFILNPLSKARPGVEIHQSFTVSFVCSAASKQEASSGENHDRVSGTRPESPTCSEPYEYKKSSRLRRGSIKRIEQALTRLSINRGRCHRREVASSPAIQIPFEVLLEINH